MGYIDWSITVPLQMIEFNLILQASKAPIGPGGFWRLLVGTVAMLAFGYAGETKSVDPWLGFALGLAGWAFILFEVFAGESAQASGARNVSDAVKQSFNNMRIIVSLGWAIYPAGYFLGQVNKSASAAEALNVTYKIAVVLACWSCAKSDSEGAPKAGNRAPLVSSGGNSQGVDCSVQGVCRTWELMAEIPCS